MFSKLNSKCVSRDKNQNVVFKIVLLLAIQENEYREKKRKPSNTINTLFIYNSSATLEPSFMLRCTIRISSHDLTHHSVIPYRNNHATSPDVATPQLTSLSILNYTATISPLPPRLPTSPPFCNTIPSIPSVSFFYISQVPPYLLTP